MHNTFTIQCIIIIIIPIIIIIIKINTWFHVLNETSFVANHGSITADCTFATTKCTFCCPGTDIAASTLLSGLQKWEANLLRQNNFAVTKLLFVATMDLRRYRYKSVTSYNCTLGSHKRALCRDKYTQARIWTDSKTIAV